jgi:cold shock CspA family protein
MKGTITRMLHVKGFGFLRDEDGHSRFFHAGALVDQDEFFQLKTGQSVEFTPEDVGSHYSRRVGLQDNGLRAVEVRRAD